MSASWVHSGGLSAYGEGVFTLPGGVRDGSGAVHREVELRSPTGREEECFSELEPRLCAAGFTSQLLMRCLKRIGPLAVLTAEHAGDLLPRDRDFLIIKLYRCTFGPKLWIGIDCPDPTCGKRMDIELMLDEVPFDDLPLKARYFSTAGVEFRLPTGADLERITEMHLPEDEAHERLFAMCLRDPEQLVALSAQTREAIENRMQELAPPAEPEMEAVCPECGRTFTGPLELVPLLLSELRGSNQKLEREVHLLAWHYHWPESEILALSRKKRQRYLALVLEELEEQPE